MLLRSQDERFVPVARALRDGNLDAAPITLAERLLLEFIGTLTRHAYKITDSQVQGLRDAGWTDEQIAEAVYDGALFNLFVRLADAFDIEASPEWDAEGLPGALLGKSEE